MKFLTKPLIALIICLFFIWLAGAILLPSLQQQHRENNTCYIYITDGRPTKLIIDSTTYYFNSEGMLPEEVDLKMNAWHREMYEGGLCLQAKEN